MNEITVNQAYLFMIFILNGILIGLIFDIFRILRRSFDTPNIITYIEDTIFWTISALTVLYSLFVFNNGQIRGYIFIGLFLGIAMYMLFLSKTVVKISVKIIVFIKNIVYKIIKLITYPLLFILKIVKSLLIRPTKFVYNSYNSMKNGIKTSINSKIKSKNSKNLQNKEGI